MSRRALLVSITAAGIAGTAVFGRVTIRPGFRARDNPSALEAYLAPTARKLSIPVSERDAKSILVQGRSIKPLLRVLRLAAGGTS